MYVAYSSSRYADRDAYMLHRGGGIGHVGRPVNPSAPRVSPDLFETIGFNPSDYTGVGPVASNQLNAAGDQMGGEEETSQIEEYGGVGNDDDDVVRADNDRIHVDESINRAGAFEGEDELVQDEGVIFSVSTELNIIWLIQRILKRFLSV